MLFDADHELAVMKLYYYFPEGGGDLAVPCMREYSG